MSETSSLKNIIKNAAILLTGNTGANIMGLLSLSIFTHSLGAELFGYYVLYLAFIEIMSKLFSFQSWQGFIKFGTSFKEKNEHKNYLMLLKYSFYIDFITSMFAFILVVALGSYAVQFFAIPDEFKNILIFMSFTVVFQVMEVTTGIFRVYDRFKIQAKIAVYAAFFKLILFGVVAITSATFELFIYMTVLAQFIQFMLKIYFAKKLLNENGVLVADIATSKIDFSVFREIKYLSFVVYNNFSWSVRMVSRQFDTVLLGKLFGAETVGLYKIAKEIANIIAKLTDPIYQTIYPEFARMLESGKKKETRDIAIKIALITTMAGVMFYLAFVLLGKWAIVIAFGEEFRSAYSITLVYFIAILIAIISLPLVPLLLSHGLAKEAFYNQLLATAVYAMVLYPLTYFYAAIGTSLAYVVFYLVWVCLTFYVVKKHRII